MQLSTQWKNERTHKKRNCLSRFHCVCVYVHCAMCINKVFIRWIQCFKSKLFLSIWFYRKQYLRNAYHSNRWRRNELFCVFFFSIFISRWCKNQLCNSWWLNECGGENKNQLGEEYCWHKEPDDNIKIHYSSQFIYRLFIQFFGENCAKIILNMNIVMGYYTVRRMPFTHIHNNFSNINSNYRRKKKSS